MKIKEVIERDCCQPNDLKPYLGETTKPVKNLKPVFCIHCGQVYVHVHDPEGDISVLKKGEFVY